MIKLRIKIILSFLLFLFPGSEFANAQVEDPNVFSVISNPLSTLSSAQGWSLQDNGKWAYEMNTIPTSNSRTVRNPSPKERLGLDNFIHLELKKVLIEDKQYNVLIKIFRDGEYEFPMLEDDWRNYNSAKFWVFPAENLINVFPEEVEFDNAYAVNMDVYCYGKIDDYNPYTLNDKIVNKINRTIDATSVNAANLVIAVWPLRDNDAEVIRFKIVETYNKKTITGYYLEPTNIKKIFSNSYYQTYYYEFKSFIKDAVIYNIPVESVSSEYMSFYRWGVSKIPGRKL
ncbi:MAG: hypothetical protein U5Q03_06795 [Bacteroidota bacterium]|nr:hypothetical protein [Bacteroidota bacterium]